MVIGSGPGGAGVTGIGGAGVTGSGPAGCADAGIGSGIGGQDGAPSHGWYPVAAGEPGGVDPGAEPGWSDTGWLDDVGDGCAGSPADVSVGLVSPVDPSVG
jgi:hypothetical protein